MYCYQLTPIGAPMPGLFVSSEISSSGKGEGYSFSVKGGKPRSTISWMVTRVQLQSDLESHEDDEILLRTEAETLMGEGIRSRIPRSSITGGEGWGVNDMWEVVRWMVTTFLISVFVRVLCIWNLLLTFTCWCLVNAPILDFLVVYSSLWSSSSIDWYCEWIDYLFPPSPGDRFQFSPPLELPLVFLLLCHAAKKWLSPNSEKLRGWLIAVPCGETFSPNTAVNVMLYSVGLTTEKLLILRMIYNFCREFEGVQCILDFFFGGPSLRTVCGGRCRLD